MMQKLYLSPLGIIISWFLRRFSIIHKPFMIYGYRNKKSGIFQKHTRISSTTKLIHKKDLDIADHVWIGHYCLIDGTGGVSLGEGVQISSHSVVYSHSSQDAIRLLGKDFISVTATKRTGYKIKPVSIGAYTFVGTSSVILPGATIGKGCIIGAGSVVKGSIPDYAIASGNPIQIIGDTRERDKNQFSDQINPEQYYDPEAMS